MLIHIMSGTVDRMLVYDEGRAEGNGLFDRNYF